jgi:hypothetical protein
MLRKLHRALDRVEGLLDELLDELESPASERPALRLVEERHDG